MIRNTKLQYNTIACLLAILCYGLPFFHDNALGGLVKPTIIIMAKSQKGGSQPPKKQTNTGGSLGDIWTGPFKESPAYKKVMAKKATGQANLDAYKKNADAKKAAAIKKVKGK